MNSQTDNNKQLIYQLQSNPQLLSQQPELFQKAVIEFLISIDKRIAKIEERWMTTLI